MSEPDAIQKQEQGGDENQNQNQNQNSTPGDSVPDLLASGDASAGDKDYVLALDLGTTTVRAHIYDKAGQSKGYSFRQQEVLHPQPGYSEIEPENLIDNVCGLIHECIKDAGLNVSQIKCMGMTTLRAAFVIWDKETGKPYHNIISWQDLRAADYVNLWNKSYTLQALNKGAKVLYTLVKKRRYLAASVLKFMSRQVTMRLLWVLDNIPEVRKRAMEGKALFGCTDTWVLWRLTGGKSHLTDYSCASSTGIYDPFQMEWSTIVCGLVNIPMMMLPEVKDTSGYFGTTSSNVLGCEIPITAIVADQQGAMFGHCCFNVGDIKCTLGTGTFVNLNTGNKPHASIAGLYPLVAWKIGKELTFMAEGSSADTANVIMWAKSMGFFEDVQETAAIAESVPASDGLYFVPAFSGIQSPFNDDKATTTFFGIKATTTKAHMVRSILEAISFRFKALFETVLTETKIPLSHIRMDGGVARNNFVIQLMSDLVNQSVDRCLEDDMACVGVAFLAGLATGVWSSKAEIASLSKDYKRFEPRHTWPQYKNIYREWESALQRSLNWYE